MMASSRSNGTGTVAIESELKNRVGATILARNSGMPRHAVDK
jgi:hypothetical protein